MTNEEQAKAFYRGPAIPIILGTWIGSGVTVGIINSSWGMMHGWGLWVILGFIMAIALAANYATKERAKE